MQKLRVLLLVMLCSVLLLPRHVTALSATQVTVLQTSETDAAPVATLTAETIVAESKAVLQLDRALLLPALHHWLPQLHLPEARLQPVLASPASALKANGLHTIFTAGP